MMCVFLVITDKGALSTSIDDQEVPTLSRDFMTCNHATNHCEAVVPSNVTQKLEDVKNIIAEPEEYWRVNKVSDIPTSTIVNEDCQQVQSNDLTHYNRSRIALLLNKVILE